MSARTKARKRALDILFEADVRQETTDSIIERRREFDQHPPSDYAQQLVTGVQERRDRIDSLLETYAVGWTLERMPAVDRNILRMGMWEILWADTPDSVAIAESVALAKDLSTDESPAFVNGLLARIREVKDRLDLD